MAMKVVRQARLELSGGSTPDQLRPCMAHPMMIWAHDTITVLAKGEDQPMQGVLVDQRTYFHRLLRTRKSSTAPLGTRGPYDPRPRQQVNAHVGCT